ncbi:MraY family glycosyltransferase [Noviherbaspirillum saxi]|uniref:Glycosyl transferase 4 family protein n=1 Tax=Noviherbaspirillum saxi TaxID=2320863 RepID=A0A3A3G386_9BURK|nr:glycosyltransferase [Noviherbaspirillum saxi]RJF95876.1 glycosyl transferase 4 family protein [Noviherbaspirillum saxi]
MFFSHRDLIAASSDMAAMAMVALIASFIASMLIVCTERWHQALSLDQEMSGAQKFHKKPVPRIGGLALLAGILVVIAYAEWRPSNGHVSGEWKVYLLLVLAAMPAFISGLLEDLTKGISVRCRLLGTFASGLIACWLVGASLPRLDIWGIDLLFGLTPVAVLATAFAVAGVSNSINIIDGFNGLAGITGVIILTGLGFIAGQAGDVFVAKLAIVGIGVTIGFLLVNYPTGRIFLGDGGAYLLGFWIAEVAVLTIARNPSINAWQILAVCAYPVIEVIYSIYRKKVIRKMNPGVPDRLHFHMLVYRRFICQLLPGDGRRSWVRNAMVTCAVVSWTAPLTFIAVYYGDTILRAMGILAIQLFAYLAFYVRLVRGHWCFNPAVGFGLLPERRTKSH